MNFYETASKMESRIQEFYRELADKCIDNEGLKYILHELLMDHKQHAAKLQQMKTDECSDLKISGSFKSTIDFFLDLQDKHETFTCDIDQANMYRQAVELIEKKIEFYEKGLQELECNQNQSVLAEIIKEEKRHKFVLQNIIEIVSRPHSWIENAEFNHLEEY